MDPESEAWVARRAAHENEQAAREAFGLTRLPWKLNKRVGFIYVVWAEDTNLIKLGYTTKPTQRLRELQTGSPHKLVLIDAFPADIYEEKSVHYRWRDSHAYGEWFHLTQEMADLIDKLTGKLS